MLKHILIPLVVLVAASNAPVASKQQLPPPQHPVHIKTSVPMDLETMLSRIFPFYRGDPWLNMGRNDFDARYSLSKLRLSNKLIVPMQEPNKISVPFKGWINNECVTVTKDGNARLVLKIYDQSNGGTKLYEEAHEVEVIKGQYFAMVQVPSEILAKSQTVWLEAASVEAKAVAFEPRTSFATRPPEGASASISFFVGLCYTCGGLFQMTGGIPVPSGNPTEYGSGCLAPLLVRTDYRPFLCKTFNTP